MHCAAFDIDTLPRIRQEWIDAIVAGRLTAERDHRADQTPTFFINGAKVLGDQPYAEFEKALNAASPKR